MPISAATPNNQKWIQSRIDEVKQHFGEDVVKIRYNLGTDWAGDPAIYFRILVPDAVADDDDRLGDVGSRIRRELTDKLALPDSDRFPYFIRTCWIWHIIYCAENAGSPGRSVCDGPSQPPTLRYSTS